MRAVYWALVLIAFGFSALAQTYQELDDLGYQEFGRGNYPAALEAFSKSLALKQTQFGPEHPLTGSGHLWLGLIYTVLDQYPPALEHFQAARQIFEKSLGPHHPMTGQVYLSLGDLYAAANDYPNAVAFYDQAGRAFAAGLGPDNPSSALLLTKTSLLYTRLGDLPKALRDALEAVRIYEKAQGSLDPATAAAYEQAAYVYAFMADQAGELEYLKKALAARERANGIQSPEAAEVLKSLGELYQRQGDYPRAVEALGRAQTIYESTLGPAHPKTALLYTSLGRIYAALKDHARAVELLQKAQPVLARAFGPQSLWVATVDMELGNVYLELGDYPRALSFMSQSLPIFKKLGPENFYTAVNYSALGTVYLRQGEFQRALEGYQQGFAAFFAQQALAFSILDNAGKLRYKNQNQAFAWGMLSAISQLPGASLTQRQQVLDNWLSFKGSAFAFENGLSLLQQGASPELKTLLEQYLNLRRELAGLYTRTPEDEASARAAQAQIATRAEALAHLERDLSSKVQAFAELLALQRIRWSDLARQLRPDELYLDYAWTDKTLFALTLDAGGEVGIYLLGTTPEVAAQVATMRTLIEAGKPFEALAPASQALYAVLIRPLEGRLGRAHTLVISPDGPLAFLPFELLSDGSRLLLERYVIRYTPTGRDLIRLRLNPSPVAAGPAAVFGNPSFGLAVPVGARSGPSRSLTELLRNANFAALPGTEGEAQVVAALLGAQTRLFLGEAANEQNLFGLESPRVLHLATHGFFVNDLDIPNPLLRVGIALAGAKASVAAGEQYGLLTALQLAALNLRGTRLVVLSACETGLGDVVAGEGVAGLNQAFLTAGARGIVLSLWKVPDRETGLLMERFYQLWTAGKPEAEALREAKLELRQRGLAPWYWAAFLLSGE